MATIVVQQSDIDYASTFLQTYLTEKVPDADFSEGSAVYDFAVRAISSVYAYVTAERMAMKARMTLAGLAALDPKTNDDIDESVDALLSNWFITRKSGTQASITATLHFSHAADCTILPTTRFFRTASNAYILPQNASLTLFGSNMLPNLDSSSNIIDYTTNVSLVAQTTGAGYNYAPGKFTQVDVFSPYFTYANNVSEGYDGNDIETTAALEARAPTAITVRNLINARSINTVLLEKFSGLNNVVTIGYGDPEMLRDYSTESTTGLKMHVGGYTDIFVSLPRTEVTENLTIGNAFARPDNLIIVLRDTTKNFGSGVSGLNVQQGHILNITAGLLNTPLQYIINSVSADGTSLEVNARLPFPAATDEAGTYINYSIGQFAPSFNSILTTQTTGQTSRKVQTNNQVTLTGQPVYAVKSVSVVNGSAITSLTTRVNGTLTTGQYSLSVAIPGNSQSSLAVTYVNVPPGNNSFTLRITYETLLGFSNVTSYVSDPFERVNNANQLVRALHPVYIGASFICKQASGKPVIDTTAVSAAAVAYINAFDFTKPFDVTGLTASIRSNSSIASLTNFQLTYKLLGPDGQVYLFATGDIVTIAPNVSNYPLTPSNNAMLTNPTGITLLGGGTINAAASQLPVSGNPGNVNNPIAVANVQLATQLTALGVSDRTVRYLATLSDFSVTVA